MYLYKINVLLKTILAPFFRYIDQNSAYYIQNKNGNRLTQLNNKYDGISGIYIV